MMSPSGFEHGRLVVRVTLALASHVDQHKLGVVTGAETGFILERNPDTVRAPDVGFVRRERLPVGRQRGFFDGPPDLAVEVVSPSDRPADIDAKVRQWLDAGCLAVWVVDPDDITITVHRPGQPARTLGHGEHLEDQDVVLEFSLSVAEVFREG